MKKGEVRQSGREKKSGQASTMWCRTIREFRRAAARITAIWCEGVKNLETVGLDETSSNYGGLHCCNSSATRNLIGIGSARCRWWSIRHSYPFAYGHASFPDGRRLLKPQSAIKKPQVLKRKSGDIAVIGIACPFPGAHGPEHLARGLKKGWKR